MPASARIPLLITSAMQDRYVDLFRDLYDVVYAPDAAAAPAIAEHGGRIRALVTLGTIGAKAAQMQAMPRLELICVLGAGFEGVDLATAKARGIAVCNGAGTNDACVADHAFGLLLAAVRGIARLDKRVREGRWREGLFNTPSVHGKKLGIVGLGMIGRQIAKRAGGFDMEMGYVSRSRKADVPYRFFDNPLELARWCDYMIVATPGGAATQHLINAEVIAALGRRGTLVNIGRGSVVDTQALAAALASGALASAGLDVYEHEPQVPPELTALPNVVLTPHIGGRSPEAAHASIEKALANLQAWSTGRPLLTPVQ